MTARVGSGRGTPADANMASKAGITKTSRIATAGTVTATTSVGYISAPRTFLPSDWVFSRKSERRSSMVSSAPAASPAATMLTVSSENARGCLRIAPANVSPDCTSYTSSWTTLRNARLFVCLARTPRLGTMGRPAPTMVENSRAKTATSLAGTLFTASTPGARRRAPPGSPRSLPEPARPPSAAARTDRRSPRAPPRA